MQAGGSFTRHLGEHVPIHCPQAVSTESHVRKLGHIPKHIRRQVLQLVVPQVEFLVPYSTRLLLWHLTDIPLNVRDGSKAFSVEVTVFFSQFTIFILTLP